MSARRRVTRYRPPLVAIGRSLLITRSTIDGESTEGSRGAYRKRDHRTTVNLRTLIAEL